MLAIENLIFLILFSFQFFQFLMFYKVYFSIFSNVQIHSKYTKLSVNLQGVNELQIIILDTKQFYVLSKLYIIHIYTSKQIEAYICSTCTAYKVLLYTFYHYLFDRHVRYLFHRWKQTQTFFSAITTTKCSPETLDLKIFS